MLLEVSLLSILGVKYIFFLFCYTVQSLYVSYFSRGVRKVPKKVSCNIWMALKVNICSYASSCLNTLLVCYVDGGCIMIYLLSQKSLLKEQKKTKPNNLFLCCFEGHLLKVIIRAFRPRVCHWVSQQKLFCIDLCHSKLRPRVQVLPARLSCMVELGYNELSGTTIKCSL